MSTALTRALQPVLPILTAPETEDLAIQEPGVGWWMKAGAWHRIALPAMTYARLHGISVMAAAQTRQVITPRTPDPVDGHTWRSASAIDDAADRATRHHGGHPSPRRQGAG